ncbi:cytochrome c oxidase subunit 2A [Paenibacillus xanthanilyticus]|uniref:Cytochrome c oxidase subunit 2A n=1 Tax=Paenibacillus xanthanilyticus TaxID=1783531 RepID=A0ABV8K7K5_9BACL
MGKQQTDHDESLKGSFYFVLAIGLFILLLWIAIFVLYISQS